MTHVRNPPINYLANVTQKNLTHLASSNVPYIGPRDCFASQGMLRFLFQHVSDKQSKITTLHLCFCAPVYTRIRVENVCFMSPLLTAFLLI